MTCTQDGRVEGCVPIFSRENSKIVTNRWTVECQIPPKKDTLCPRSKEKPQQDGRRGEIVFRIITHICQRCSQSSNITFCTAGPRDPTRDWARPAFEHLSVSWETQVSCGLPWGQGLWLQQTCANYKLALTKSIANNWTKAFAVCLYRVWTLCCCSCWSSTTPEGVQGRVRHSVLQGIWWDRSLDSWMFSGTDFRISLLLLISRKALNPFMVTSDPHD